MSDEMVERLVRALFVIENQLEGYTDKDWKLDRKIEMNPESIARASWILQAVLTPADILALLREWGGKERMLCREHHARYNDGAPGCEVWMAVKQGGGEPRPCQVEPFFLLPLDVLAADTGSET